ncbi:putative disease resistance RPP13-like protein 1 [Henckelia pumila]|uniref:putative disease resistance RPP13-like protein 1 n=1 Tax=Henckelia pumila TaxID=405737 RepID=UPI003C6EA36B
MAYSLFVSGFPSGFGSAFFQFALERLASFGSFAWKEVKLIWDVEDELKKLRRTMSRVQDLVDHVECYPLRMMGGSKAWKIWFADIKKLSYDADSIVDYISWYISTSGSIPQAEVRNMILSSGEFQLSHEINELQNKLEDLAREMEGLLMIEKIKGSPNLMSPHIHNILSTSSLVDENTVVGRATAKEMCLDMLKSQQGGDINLSVMSLVGMAGIGKTTLARLVYDDKSVNKVFDKKMWVSVSMKFDMIGITKSILEALTGNSCALADLNSVQVLLRRVIQGLKFLLVLDDYWNEKHTDWNLLSLPLKLGSQGSKVIVTTRSAKVSAAVQSFQTYNLRYLSNDECWAVMKQRLFFQVEGQENLEFIGREIANNCKGLPLAAEMLGSLLSNSECSENEWRCILKGNLWDLPLDKNDLFSALMLSYLHLPSQLQKCFAYCSLFPQNHEFEVEELVLLWMAEGFIQPIEGWRLEDLGRRCFNDLYSRSFFQQDTNSSNQIIYRMHDFVHDLAQIVSTDVCLQVTNMRSDCCPLFGDTCHLSMLCDCVESIHLRASQKNKRLRTFLMINKRRAREGLLNNELFAYLQFLRVLDLSRIGLVELTDSFGHLKYLRYLNLSENRISMLPKSVCDLLALQTLKLKNCRQIRELPDETKNLSNLRHLDLDIKGQLTKMPPHFGRLTNLQSLSAFIVGNKEENGISQMSDMNLLRGSLCIKNIQLVNVGDATQAKLRNKEFLDKLELQWVPLTSGVQQNALQEAQNRQGFVLSNLRPHENLKELVIDKYCGIICPIWFCEPNRKLTSIHLQGLKYCESLPPLGQLLSLKSFYISDMPLLESMDDDFYGTRDSVKFPSLVLFEVRRMTRLISWVYTATFVSMPLLNSFTIHDCPNLISIPANLMSHGNSNINDCANLLIPAQP